MLTGAVLLLLGAGAQLTMVLDGGNEVGPTAVSPSDLAVVVGEEATPPERRAAELLAAEIAKRTGVRPHLGASAGARRTLVIGTPSSGKALAEFAAADPRVAGLTGDGYVLTTQAKPDGRLFVVGRTPGGVVAGVGRLLRLMRYGEGRLEIPEADLADSPDLPVRGIYFATHFGNFYHVAPLEEVDRVIEDLALWGLNELIVWFDMHHFQGIDDPVAQEHLARLRHFGDTAHSLGMRFGLTFIANEAYDSSPVELRADGRTGTAHYGRELCPSKPEALALIGRWQAEVIDSFPQVDFIWTWPYDQGGCACPDCAPWGANGFLRASEQLARIYHERFPDGTVWLSTWLFDLNGDRGEHAGLGRYLEGPPPEWMGGVIAGTHGDWIPEPLLSRPHPERYPLTSFPEISMYAMDPWGEHGANPLPGFCSRLEERLRGNTVGGWPYSEGIYEDLNKVLFARFYWDEDVATDDALREYAGYYLGPEAAEDAVRLFRLMEASHARTGWQVADLSAGPEEARLAASIDARLAPWARESWRWRILAIRASIDGILASEGVRTADAQGQLRPLCDELRRIYHASGTFIAPPELPALPVRKPGNLAFGCEVTASSTVPDRAGSEKRLVNGVLSEMDGEDFWASDPAQGDTAAVTLDLGGIHRVGEVRVQLRGLYGVYWFVPERIELSTSTDGEEFALAASLDALPAEGAPYSPELLAMPLDREARYLRLRLGPSQHRAEPYPGTLELTEVEVYGAGPGGERR